MITKLSALLILLSTSLHGLAAIHISPRMGSSSYSGPLDTLILMIVGMGALYFYYKSFLKWIKRRSTGEKPERKLGLDDWGITLAGYVLVSIFVCGPIFEILQSIGDYQLVRDTWYIVFIFCFGLLFFLRRT
ncbi:putative four-helix membrane protein [Acinetobacter oleivorans]